MYRSVRQLIEKNTFLYNILKKIYRNTVTKYIDYKDNLKLKENGTQALYDMDDAFKELGISYWLEFGTLLGAVREKGFIEHDADIDLGLFAKDYSEKIEKTLSKYGFKKVKEILIDNGDYGREETYRYNGLQIDLFYFHLRDNEIFCHTFVPFPNQSRDTTIAKIGGLVVRELRYPYTGFKYINLFGKSFLIPSNTKEHLSASYGKSYMIKDPNYSNNIATNDRIIPDKIGIIRQYQ